MADHHVYQNKCTALMNQFQCTCSVLEDDDGPYLLVEVSNPDQNVAQKRLIDIDDHLKAYRTHTRGVQREGDRYLGKLTARLRSDGGPPVG